jgi:hypothetical protein
MAIDVILAKVGCLLDLLASWNSGCPNIEWITLLFYSSCCPLPAVNRGRNDAWSRKCVESGGFGDIVRIFILELPTVMNFLKPVVYEEFIQSQVLLYVITAFRNIRASYHGSKNHQCYFDCELCMGLNRYLMGAALGALV